MGGADSLGMDKDRETPRPLATWKMGVNHPPDWEGTLGDKLLTTLGVLGDELKQLSP